MTSRRYRTSEPGVFKRGHGWQVAWRDPLGRQHWRWFADFHEACDFKHAVASRARLSRSRYDMAAELREARAGLNVAVARFNLAVRRATARVHDAA